MRLLMAIAKAGKTGIMYHSSFVWATVKIDSTIAIHKKINVSSLMRFQTLLKRQRIAAKGKAATKYGLSVWAM